MRKLSLLSALNKLPTVLHNTAIAHISFLFFFLVLFFINKKI